MCRLRLRPYFRSIILGTSLTGLFFPGCGWEQTKNGAGTAENAGPSRNGYKAMTDGPIYQRMTHIDALARQFMSTDEGDPVQARAALQNSSTAIIATAKSVLESDSLDEFDRTRAAKALFEAYGKQVNADSSRYTEFLSACDDLIQRFPKTDLATQAAFVRLNVLGTLRSDKLSESDELRDPKKRLNRVSEAALLLAEQEPPHPSTPEVLLNLARQLEQDKDFERSAKVYGLLNEKFPDPEKRRFVPGHLRRISMVGQPVQGIQGKDFEGQEITIEQFKGKVVLIDFWASWCPPCLAELDGMKQLREELGPKGFEILGMNADDDAAAARKIINDRKLNWPEIVVRSQTDEMINPEETLEFKLGIEYLPTKLLINREGILVWCGSQLELARPEIEKLVAETTELPATAEK